MDTWATLRKKGTKCQPMTSPISRFWGFAHQGADAAQCGADRAVHHQVAQEGAELREVGPVLLFDGLVGAEVMGAVHGLAGGEPVVHVVEPVGPRR